MLKDKPPTIFGDGLQSRDFTYIENVVDANLLAAKAKKTAGQVVNIACGQAVTVNEIIDYINELLGKNIEPVYDPPRPGDVKHSLADITLAQKLIAFEPTIPFQKGLELAIDWYRDNLL
jgi:UDP-glucose 4-epimerase